VGAEVRRSHGRCSPFCFAPHREGKWRRPHGLARLGSCGVARRAYGGGLCTHTDSAASIRIVAMAWPDGDGRVARALTPRRAPCV
jgi:hypothetical protein